MAISVPIVGGEQAGAVSSDYFIVNDDLFDLDGKVTFGCTSLCTQGPAPLAGAAVDITGSTASQTLATNEDGKYSTALPRGSYEVSSGEDDLRFDPDTRSVDLDQDTSGVDFGACGNLDLDSRQPRRARQPQPQRCRIPIMIGGGGEKKTLRLVALYADESNLICRPSEVARKLDALAGHCASVGRDRAEVVVSLLASCCIAPTHEQAVAEADAYLAARGIHVSSLNEAEADQIRSQIVLGDPDEVGEIFSSRKIDGVDGFTVNSPANGHIEGRVELLGEVLRKVVDI